MAPEESQALYKPELRDMLRLEVPVDIKVSPNGSRVAYKVRTTNWKDDRYEVICHIYDLADGSDHILTRSGSVYQMEWIDDQTLALTKKGGGDEDKPQVYIYQGLVGEGWAVTSHKTGVEWFKPFAGGFVFLARDPERDEKKPRSERFGKYTHFEQENSASALYYTGLDELQKYQAEMKAATEESAKELVLPVVELSRLLEEPLSIRSVIVSPAGGALYINCWKRDDLVYFRQTSTYRIHLDPRNALSEYISREKAKKAEKKDTTEKNSEENKEKEKEKEDLSYLGEITRLNLPEMASVVAVSPDGSRLLVDHAERDQKMYTRRDAWSVSLETALQAPDAEAFLAGMHNLTAPLDRELMDVYWVESGIFASFVDSTFMRVTCFSEDGQITPLDFQGIYPFEFHISASGHIGLIGGNAQSISEVYIAKPARGQPQQLTSFGKAVEGWSLGKVETIRWKSKDGTQIEGVLRKPADFDPGRKYPLVLIVHGGPTWFSPEILLAYEDQLYYPSVQFVNKDVLVLKPNYRGSIGRGQAFTELNVNNLGVGDLWDLESAIEHLDGLGWIDKERVGCMGWSQGGYISAFAGLHSDKFKAVSVGAGISDWYTYHISNDIPDFTIDYLSGSPFRSRELYTKTAPMSNITNAKTPMLIQHGAEDRRVPFSNAMELYRGLKEMGVPVELFAFPGMGHPITRPRENHAVMYQNLAWFNHYLLGEELKLE